MCFGLATRDAIRDVGLVEFRAHRGDLSIMGRRDGGGLGVLVDGAPPSPSTAPSFQFVFSPSSLLPQKIVLMMMFFLTAAGTAL